MRLVLCLPQTLFVRTLHLLSRQSEHSFRMPPRTLQREGRPFRILSFLSLLILLGSCSPLSGYRELAASDYQPPLLLEATTVSPVSFRLEFSEPVRAVRESFSLTREGSLDTPAYGLEFMLEPSGTSADGTILLTTTEPAIAGERLLLKGQAADAAGNTLIFSAAVYGFNDSVPQMIISEFTTQGTAANPDRVEITILSDGNLAGVTFFDGLSDDYIQRVTLPPIEAAAGDRVIIHCGKEPAQVSEAEAKDQSTAPTASAVAWDVWITDGSGLSGNNGIISLYDAPRGKLIDAVLYSNRTVDSDTRYGGFGSSALQRRVQTLFAVEGWVPAASVQTGGGLAEEFDRLVPEDGVNPDPSTATRSMCRREPPTDTDSRLDWYVVPTGRASFGEPNFPEAYQP